MKSHNKTKLGIYYSVSQDALIHLNVNDSGQLCCIYDQWCPPGVFFRNNKDGVYGYGFMDTNLTEHNFNVMWKTYKPKFISDLDYLTFAREILIPLMQLSKQSL